MISRPDIDFVMKDKDSWLDMKNDPGRMVSLLEDTPTYEEWAMKCCLDGTDLFNDNFVCFFLDKIFWLLVPLTTDKTFTKMMTGLIGINPMFNTLMASDMFLSKLLLSRAFYLIVSQRYDDRQVVNRVIETLEFIDKRRKYLIYSMTGEVDPVRCGQWFEVSFLPFSKRFDQTKMDAYKCFFGDEKAVTGAEVTLYPSINSIMEYAQRKASGYESILRKDGLMISEDYKIVRKDKKRKEDN